MTERLRRTVRSFLRGERPATRHDALALVTDWFGRYDPDPELLEEEIDRHFGGMPPVGGKDDRLVRLRGD